MLLANAGGKGMSCCYSVEREKRLMRKSRSDWETMPRTLPKWDQGEMQGHDIYVRYMCRSSGFMSVCNKAKTEKTQSSAYQLMIVFT